MEPLNLKECCQKRTPISVSGKCSDLCYVRYPDGKEHNGEVPRDLNIGSGDYIQFEYCANCGMIQDKFPIELE